MLRPSLFLACLLSASAYEIKLSMPVKAGASEKGKTHFWRPRGGVPFGTNKAVLTVQTKSEGCACYEEGGDTKTCDRPCTQSAAVFTVDGGSAFHRHEGEEFCGPKSIPTTVNDEYVRLCGDESKQEAHEDSITMPVTQWSLKSGGILASPKLTATKVDKKITVWTRSIKASQPKSVKFGNNILDMPEKKLLFRLATVEFEDETIPVVLKSQDQGMSWIFLGRLPTGISEKNSLERVGENGLRVHMKDADNKVWRLSSSTLGRKWDNATEVPEFLSLPTLMYTRFTTFLAGGRGGPTLLTMGEKKGSEKAFNLVKEHNEQAEDTDDFNEQFLESTKALSKNEECRASPFPADDEKCQSTGLVDVVPLGNPSGDQNMTDYLLCYDKLGRGWQGPADGDEDSVYCMKATLNETKEAAAFEAKLRKKEERKRAEREAREKAEQYAQQQRDRKKREKREKDKKLREKRNLWTKLDAELNVAPALEFEAADGELIIVRDLQQNNEYLEFMEDSVGVPEKEVKLAAEPEGDKEKEGEETASAEEEKSEAAP